MATVLIYSQQPVEKELQHTLLWRDDIQRYLAGRADQVRMLGMAARPSLVLIDRDVPDVQGLIRSLREEPATRGVSLALFARTGFEPFEVELLEAGVNGILRLPADDDWDRRVARLLAVPGRREARLPVSFAVQARSPWPSEREHVIPALALNLSINGMLLETSMGLDVGDEVALDFRLPGEAGEVVRARGRVVREDDRTRFGVEMHEVDGRGRVAIRDFVEDRAVA